MSDTRIPCVCWDIRYVGESGWSVVYDTCDGIHGVQHPFDILSEAEAWARENLVLVSPPIV